MADTETMVAEALIASLSPEQLQRVLAQASQAAAPAKPAKPAVPAATKGQLSVLESLWTKGKDTGESKSGRAKRTISLTNGDELIFVMITRGPARK